MWDASKCEKARDNTVYENIIRGQLFRILLPKVCGSEAFNFLYAHNFLVSISLVRGSQTTFGKLKEDTDIHVPIVLSTLLAWNHRLDDFPAMNINGMCNVPIVGCMWLSYMNYMVVDSRVTSWENIGTYLFFFYGALHARKYDFMTDARLWLSLANSAYLIHHVKFSIYTYNISDGGVNAFLHGQPCWVITFVLYVQRVIEMEHRANSMAADG